MRYWLERGGIGVIFALGMTIGVVLFLLLTSGVRAGAFVFHDVQGQPWYRSSLDHMSEMEVVRGYEDGTFRPDQYVNRAEMVTLLSRYHAYLLDQYFPQHSLSDSRFLESFKTPSGLAHGEQKKIAAIASEFIHNPSPTRQEEPPSAAVKASSCAN